MPTDTTREGIDASSVEIDQESLEPELDKDGNKIEVPEFFLAPYRKKHYTYDPSWKANVNTWKKCEIPDCKNPAGFRCEKDL